MTGYYFTDRNPRELPSRKMEWLVTHWHIRNTSANALNLYDWDFSATTLGVLETPDPFVVDGFGYHGMPKEGFVLPGQQVKGTEIIPVFKQPSQLKVTFIPTAGNPNLQSETWTVTR